MEYLSAQQLEQLREYDSPTVCNAIERFNIRPNDTGYTDSSIVSILPFEKPFVGYAATVRFSSSTRATPEQAEMWMDYYACLQKTPRPAIVVAQDMDERSVGAFWGEVQATTQKALGAVALVTNGMVRDLDACRGLGFGLFARGTLSSHAYVHLEDYNCPVVIGGLKILPNDLVFSDIHGTVVIPHQIAEELAEECRLDGLAEQPIIQGCRKVLEEHGEVDLEQLRQWRAETASLRQRQPK